MGEIIRTYNRADGLAILMREGKLCPYVFLQEIVKLGFYAVRVEPEMGKPKKVIAYYNNVRFEL